MLESLKKLYVQENNELKAMQKVVEKQQKSINKQSNLNRETIDYYISLLNEQQKGLGYSILEVADRQRAIVDLETALQNAQTSLQIFGQEVQQKSLMLTQQEAIYKSNSALLKSEKKAAKSIR